METQKIRELVQAAWEARKRAYAPYSHFQVGAALLAEDGQIFIGCNVENISYGASVCAERSAVFAAVSSGKRKFLAMAVAGSDREYTFPCGICRQVLAEFNVPEIICARTEEDYIITDAKNLFPAPFSNTELKGRKNNE